MPKKHVEKKTIGEKIKENLSVIISFCIVISMILGAFGWFESRYARKKTELKLDYINYTIQQQLNTQKITEMMARCPNGIENADPSTKDILKDLMEKKEKLKVRIDTLEKQGIGIGLE